MWAAIDAVLFFGIILGALVSAIAQVNRVLHGMAHYDTSTGEQQ